MGEIALMVIVLIGFIGAVTMVIAFVAHVVWLVLKADENHLRDVSDSERRYYDGERRS